jgi:hypothetical protein
LFKVASWFWTFNSTHFQTMTTCVFAAVISIHHHNRLVGWFMVFKATAMTQMLYSCIKIVLFAKLIIITCVSVPLNYTDP